MIAKLDRWYDLATTRIFDKLRSPLLLVLRLIFGWGLFQTGKGKLENIDRFIEFLTRLHIPAPAANAWFVASLECVGGLLLILGLASRLICIPLTINFIVAFLTADREAVVNFFKDQDAFTNAAPFLYLLVSLLVLAFGPGIFSLDELIRRMRRRRQA
ncbi:MAG: putative oxidoreductase [Thermoanaerobaculia bacterium]|jgi:putative oxidoreductase|nr:putative oxidoreductase [Thermoanaerobaculia bacterium]